MLLRRRLLVRSAVADEIVEAIKVELLIYRVLEALFVPRQDRVLVVHWVFLGHIEHQAQLRQRDSSQLPLAGEFFVISPESFEHSLNTGHATKTRCGRIR
jgi:hypothetical protein